VGDVAHKHRLFIELPQVKHVLGFREGTVSVGALNVGFHLAVVLWD